MSGQQQLVDHEEDDERRHSIIGKSFPSFSEREVEQTPGVTHEGRIVRARGRIFVGGNHSRLTDGWALSLRRFMTDRLCEEGA